MNNLPILRVFTSGRRASLNLRRLKSLYPTRRCAQCVFETWSKTVATQAAQIVFIDPAAPDSVYCDLRSELIRLGAPIGEIAFLHDYQTELLQQLEDSHRVFVIRRSMGYRGPVGGSEQLRKLIEVHTLSRHSKQNPLTHL